MPNAQVIAANAGVWRKSLILLCITFSTSVCYSKNWLSSWGLVPWLQECAIFCASPQKSRHSMGQRYLGGTVFPGVRKYCFKCRFSSKIVSIVHPSLRDKYHIASR